MKSLPTHFSLRTLFALFGVCLVGLLSACTFQPGLNADALALAHTTSSSAIQAVQMPPTETSCPADGTARAAVMRPLSLGKHQNLVYIYNEVPLNTSTADGQLKRYDTVTGQKTIIAISGLSITDAQVSADGQWILFLSQIDPRGDSKHSYVLQLVRMDGQGLQTLYCFPNNQFVSSTSIQWSTDQKSILFSTDTGKQGNGGTSTITLLTLASGALHTELQISDQLYAYSLLTWLDTTRAYVTRDGRTGPLPPRILYLLDTKNNPTTNGSSLKMLLERPARFSFLSFDSSYDGTQLFVGDCLEAANPFDTTISVGPATTGTQHTIYHQSGNICAQAMRVISAHTLFIVGQRYDSASQSFANQAWTLNTDGTHRVVLFDNTAPVRYTANPFSQFPWSNVSRDGASYALKNNDINDSFQHIVVGSFKGGNPTTIAFVGRGSVDLVGWTTF